ncbi:potassium channel family protein [Zoogloea sp.]|uniref:potassium channel family protein n=1 Tax=Zoogloea sp. TaxID=49181 RepID=UPI0026334267|nr:potassium channel family protein [Zoogloea sp.]MDD3352800.1 potassium channel family protein [Zoogloea sp.]
MPGPAATSTIFLVLRRLRTPLIVLITIFAISVLGLTLVPGPPGADGVLQRLSFFHAVYFFSYTATTIGFGEIPYAFSEQQRLWVTFSIYLSVVGWAYTLGTVFAMLQDKTFISAVAMQRFVRQVRRLREHFFLVCGYGETGRLLCKALDEMGYRAVVIEKDEAKVGELELQSYSADMPALCADAGDPETLLVAGLNSKYCRGVIALTNDDSTNLAIAIAARLLAPSLTALCRAKHADTVANMASFGTRHIINPFDKFGEYMALAIHSPSAYHLLLWLTGLPGTTVTRHRDPPSGKWVLCGYGSFGKVMTQALESAAMPVTIIDRAPPEDGTYTWIKGDGTGHAALAAAGIEDAAGIVAATGSDVNNLSIVVTAHQMNPQLFTVLRQNQVANRALFDAFESDFTMVPSEIIAHECLAILTTPLLAPFLQAVRTSEEHWAEQLLADLTSRFGWDVPSVWSVSFNLVQAPSVYRKMMRHEACPTLGELLRAPVTGRPQLHCRPLLLLREGNAPLVLPGEGEPLQLGDQLLFVGREEARKELNLTLFNSHTLDYVLTGKDAPGGTVWEWLARRRATARTR